MISKFEDLKELFEEIDKALPAKADLFLIGGAVLLYRGLKIVTKDIDAIVDEDKFRLIESALKKLKFTAKLPTAEYKKVDLNQIFTKNGFRIDLFQRTVCKGFKLSDEMKRRSEKITTLKNLAVFLCSNEDVFLFKTFTEREGDLSDCLALAELGLDWKAILEELKSQINSSGNKIWVTLVGERLDILEERGLFIPIMGEVNKLREEYFHGNI